jgi:hypothetical protein
MKNPFNKPFRESGTNKSKLLTILAFGLFIFLFLFLFKPFGIDQIKPFQQLFVTLGFGLVTAFVLIVYKFLIEKVVIGINWTLGKNILWDVLIAVSIGIANYAYSCIIFKADFIFRYLIYYMWTAILVGSIPVTIYHFMVFNNMYRDALKKVAGIEEPVFWEDEVQITAGNPRNDFKVNPKNIIYLCSNDNYVTIVTLKGDVQSKTTLRGTLKATESELSKNSRFLRCHKCYIINLDYVEKVYGHNQNKKIKLVNSGTEIPVSRTNALKVNKKILPGLPGH